MPKNTTLVAIEPELEACVETKAKRQYNQIMGELINQGEKRELAEKLEILRLFLESGELPGLRRESERHLVDGRKVKFIFYLEKGRPKYEMKIS